ncbi:hypothetical protein [Fretibacter rubidus]|uniref:hypothetical protein n=1 Tax=Fretibacter rubidus TaxID=570162 RepID=UPI00352AE98C
MSTLTRFGTAVVITTAMSAFATGAFASEQTVATVTETQTTEAVVAAPATTEAVATSTDAITVFQPQAKTAVLASGEKTALGVSEEVLVGLVLAAQLAAVIVVASDDDDDSASN